MKCEVFLVCCASGVCCRLVFAIIDCTTIKTILIINGKTNKWKRKQIEKIYFKISIPL